jgi:glycosyltransferase involved in cell wall biosynthesis
MPAADGAAPSLTVIVPVRDARDYLADALESVAEQGFADPEVLVVDDGSTDGSADVVAGVAPQARVLRHVTPCGPAAARNTALREARGELIAFLDADDVWVPGALRTLWGCLQERPETQFVVGATELVRMPERSARDAEPVSLLPARVAFFLPATLFRRGVFERVGMLDETLTFGEDSDWFLRAREAGVPYLLSASKVLLYRRHERNMTSGKDLRTLFVPQTIVRSLRRRREAGAVKELPPPPRLEDRDG